jgi:hypothetical protein
MARIKKSSVLTGIKKVLDNIKAFQATLDQKLDYQIRIEEGEIVKMVQNQLSRGIDGNDNLVYLIRPMPTGEKYNYYAYATEVRKTKYGSGLGSVTDVITNYMSGGFYASLYAESTGNGGWEVKSSSPLWEIIELRSGEDIIKLSPTSEKFLFENRIAPDLYEAIYNLYRV